MEGQTSIPPVFPTDLYPDAEYLAEPSTLSGRPLLMIREGLLLDERAYRALRDHPTPLRRGALLLLIIAAAAAVAQAVGFGLGVLTSPRIDLVQDRIYDAITALGLYTWWANSYPGSAQDFRFWYEGAWQAFRIFAGYPSWSTTVSAVSAVTVGAFGGWLVYGTLAHLTAKWFGGTATYTQFMGSLALAYSPLVLMIIVIFPGAAVGVPVVFLALLACKHVAVKTSHGLGSNASLAVVGAPYLIAVLVALLVTLFGAANRISQIPYLDEIIRGLRVLGPQ